MKLLIIATITIIELSICNGLLLDYRLTAACGPIIAKNCTEGGLLCESCTSLVLCTQPAGKDWVKTPVATCKSPESCVNQQCSQERDPICDGTACLPFKCTTTGIFPDPFFCNKYVLCVNTGTTARPVLKPYTTDCESGYGYNAGKGMCDKPLDKCQSPYPVEICTKAGQSKALPDNPSLYYICELNGKSLYPTIYRCKGNQVYENYACVQKK